MPRYKKKPVVVKAFQVTRENACCSGWIEDLPEWIQEQVKNGDVRRSLPSNTNKYIIIYTAYSRDRANVGDYIFKGVNGEISACSADEFEQTHTFIEE